MNSDNKEKQHIINDDKNLIAILKCTDAYTIKNKHFKFKNPK